MENKVLGLHHITAIAGDAQRNYDFYTRILGLRMVKKTVNFDDPQTYHFYFGDEVGTPGSILTFFPWPRVKQGRTGVGMATEIGYSVPDSSLGFWKNRFEKFGVDHGEITTKFGESFLPFRDPDGLNLELIMPGDQDKRSPWETEEVKADVATRGFYNITLTLRDIKATAGILTDIFNYNLVEQEKNRYRFKSDAIENAAIVDLLELPDAAPGINAGGTNHHVAFRVKNEDVLMNFRDKIQEQGIQVTPKIDRDYFFSLYFREPGGVLFELATDNPGFTRDESIENLGTDLKLPGKHEASRQRIERLLPELNT